MLEIITCSGCLENQANQLAHTGPGGCLCTEEDQDSVFFAEGTEGTGGAFNEVCTVGATVEE